MRRKASARTSVTSAVLAAVLAGGAVACSGSAQQDGANDGDTAGDTAATAQAAPPGKYHTLPEPCGAVAEETLSGLFPGVDPKDANSGTDDGTASAGPADAPYGGEPDLTYDTDRHVGCTWQHNTSLGSRRLSVDFERVVSYDTTVSDDQEAEQLFAKRADKVGLAVTTNDTNGTDGGGDSEGGDGQATEAAGGGPAGAEAQGTEGNQGGGPGSSQGPADAADGDADGDGTSGSPSPHLSASPPVEPSPRLLDGIGDAAYLDDELSGDDGTARRTVTLVFRTANVLVSIEYTQTVTDGHRTPAAEELESKTQDLANKLVGRFDDI